MLQINSLEEGLEVFKALGSEIRVQILNILMEDPTISMAELASQLDVTPGALTAHIKKLEDSGIITVTGQASSHGNKKICSINFDKILVTVKKERPRSKTYNSKIKVGQYTSCQISPTCGLANASNIIGEVDDVRYFYHPDRFSADILWFTKGFVEYSLPNFIPVNHAIDELTISMELSSEAPGVNNNWPSDLHFYINNTPIGMWTSPGDFGDVRGILTPRWWPQEFNQYGLLKHINITDQGTFIDSLKISDVTCQDLNLDYKSNISFRIAVEDDSENIGGLTIFGAAFGNYDQDINVTISYSDSAK